MSIRLDRSYVPSENDEEYMSPIHLEYFKNCLLDLRATMAVQVDGHMHRAIDNFEKLSSDYEDYAVSSVYSEMYLIAGERCRKVIDEVDRALARIESGEYGYCLKTGEEIGLERLKANPTAVFCIEAQEEIDRMQTM